MSHPNKIKIEKNIPMPINTINYPNNKFVSGQHHKIYKWECIEKMNKMEVGDSIKIEDRCKFIVSRT